MDTYSAIYKDIANIIKNHLKDMDNDVNEMADLEQIVLDYYNSYNKAISIKPRKIFLSKEIVNTTRSWKGLDFILRKFENGENLNYYQSRKVFESEYRDLLCNAWNIHHIHLSDKEVNSKEEMKNNRSEWLLFCIVTEDELYCLDVMRHPEKNQGFLIYHLLEILCNNGWMEHIGYFKEKNYVKNSLNYEVTDTTTISTMYKRYRLNLAFEINGELYIPMFPINFSKNNDSVKHILKFNNLKKCIRYCVKETDVYLNCKEVPCGTCSDQMLSIAISLEREGCYKEVVIKI